MANEIDVERLAAAYRRLVLWFGAQFIPAFGQIVVRSTPDPNVRAVLDLVLVAALLVTLIALAYYATQTASALGSKVGWLWGLAMIVVCVNVITLLALSSNATRMCRAKGIRVGFFGPKITADGSFEKSPETEDELEAYEPEWSKIGADD